VLISETAHARCLKILTLLLLPFLLACYENNEPIGPTAAWVLDLPRAPLVRPPDFTGRIEGVRSLVSTWGGPTVIVDRPTRGLGIVHFEEGALLYRWRAPNEVVPISPADLLGGDFVEVWIADVEMRSLPPQYIGLQLVIR
jgi:hypothetical protein